MSEKCLTFYRLWDGCTKYVSKLQLALVKTHLYSHLWRGNYSRAERGRAIERSEFKYQIHLQFLQIPEA